MLYYENNNWHLSRYKVIYTDNNEQLKNYVGIGGKQWWKDLAKQHDNINIVKFVEIPVTTKQLERLDTINQLAIPDGHGTIVDDYVMEGKFPDEPSHVLEDLEVTLLKAENEILKRQMETSSSVINFHEDLIQEMIMTIL